MELREFRRKLAAVLIPPLAFIAVWILYFFTRHRFYIDDKIFKQNFIIGFWHGEILMLPILFLLYFKPRIRKINPQRAKNFHIVFSKHLDAEPMAKLCGYFGLKKLRGSSFKGGLKVLIDSIHLLKNGYDVGIVPDGPRGPCHSIADGIITMSQKTHTPIVPLRVKCSAYWQLKTWDKFIIPKPFCIIEFYALESFRVDDVSLEQAKNIFKQKMDTPDSHNLTTHS